MSIIGKVGLFYSRIPGWLIMLLIFGVLYISGLHTEVLGRVQSVILSTGIIKPDINNNDIYGAEKENSAPVSMAGKGFKVRSLSGDIMTMESLQGKTVFLNIWATWCPPCIAEMPNIQKLYDKVNSDKIVFLMLSVDNELDKPGKFIQKKGYTFPVYLPEGPLPSDFSTSAIPTTFVISPEGKIVVKKEGMADYNTKEFKDFLENL